MENQTNKLIPELRFPEFVNDGEWEEKKLDEVATILKGKGISKSDVVKNGNLPCIRYGELYTHYHETIDEIKSYTNLDANDLVLSQANDVIIPASGETQIDIATASCVLKNGIALGGDLNIIRTKVNGVFLSYYLNNAKRKDIAQLAQGISVVHLYPNQLRTLVLNIPNPAEQQKIAACLSSLDELIAAHSQKLAALKEHKKGLMQNLFSQEGETVPKWRFPEFAKDGDWEEKKLDRVCEMQAGKFVNASEIKAQLSDDLFPCYGGNGLRGYTKSFTHTGKFSLIGRQGALCGNVNLVDGSFHATEHAIVVTPKENIDTVWLYYGLKLLNLNQYATGQAQPGLSVNNLERLKLKIPRSLKEQERIADCLASLDTLMTAQSEKIEQLKLHKKGLMQGLFPKIDD